MMDKDLNYKDDEIKHYKSLSSELAG